MTPQLCLESRLRLGWSREDLASACRLAPQIIRLYEAGALSGFEDCGEAIEEALLSAEVERRLTRPRIYRMARQIRAGGLAERGARWKGSNYPAFASVS